MNDSNLLLLHKINEALITLVGVHGVPVTIVPSEKPELADFQCNAIRAIAGKQKADAIQLAEATVERLKSDETITSYYDLSVAGPGYINIKAKPLLIDPLLFLAAESPWGSAKDAASAPNVFIDFGGPNVAKPMHVGHLRSLVIGDSLQRLFLWLGGTVVSDIHYGDWGLQMGLLLAYLEGAPLHEITIKTLEEAYPNAAARAKTDEPFKNKAQTFTKLLQNGDPELTTRWEHFVVVSQQTVSRDLTALGVSFDLYEGESDTQNIIQPMIYDLVEKGIAVEDNGALIVPMLNTALVLRKSDGASLYATTDLGSLVDRINRFKPNEIIYVTDDRQQLHFKQVFEVAQMAGWAKDTRLTHAYFGTVNGLDGKPLKTRDGGVPKLHDLIVEATEKAAKKNPDVAQEVAIAALKFADLQNLRTSSYIFDLDKFLSFEGKTGPYLLYQAVRIKSVLAKEQKPFKLDVSVAGNELARQLAVKLIFGWQRAIEAAIIKLSPKEIADHVYDLAQTFSKFYSTTQIAGEPDWVGLSAMVLEQLTVGLDLLGITIPEKM